VALQGGDGLGAFFNAELDAKELLFPDANAPPHRHFPGARRMRTGWQRASDGSWQSTSLDDKRWEVFCAECGDTDGPIEEQTPPVQSLRGPYRNERHAKRAADAHFAATQDYPAGR
jgi:hypothetical protein